MVNVEGATGVREPLGREEIVDVSQEQQRGR